VLGARGEGEVGKTGVLVVGFGNDLVGDDGCGLAVARRLRGPGAPRVEEGHSDSLRLPSLWAGEGEIWLVDALVRGAPPGTIHRLSHEELMSIPQRHATAHQLSLPESLRWIAHSYPEMAGVRYRMWGIEPASLTLGEGLSPAVEAAVESVGAEILREAGDRP
jgi:hydrogenase maturation protease